MGLEAQDKHSALSHSTRPNLGRLPSDLPLSVEPLSAAGAGQAVQGEPVTESVGLREKGWLLLAVPWVHSAETEASGGLVHVGREGGAGAHGFQSLSAATPKFSSPWVAPPFTEPCWATRARTI